LQTYERSGWVPDIVVIDYADILAPPAGVADNREQINHAWKQMRSLSQEFHCLVVTATQSDAASYNQWILNRRNFTDDKRKLAHVTSMLGINQTEEEKEFGIFRYNFIASREQKYKETKCVYLASCLSIANIAVRSSW
jgi:replicative DNA helicase